MPAIVGVPEFRRREISCTISVAAATGSARICIAEYRRIGKTSDNLFCRLRSRAKEDCDLCASTPSTSSKNIGQSIAKSGNKVSSVAPFRSTIRSVG